MVKKKVKCCNGPGVVGHVFAVAGMYVLTWGLIGSSSAGVVLQSPVFWGLFLLGLAGCSMAAAHRMK
jgi:hypothetical protein